MVIFISLLVEISSSGEGLCLSLGGGTRKAGKAILQR